MNTSNRKPISKRRMLRVAGLAALLVGIVCGAVGYLVGWEWLLYLGLVALLVGVPWLVCSCFTSDEPMRAAQSRYVREFFPPMLAYVLVLFATRPLFERMHAVPLKVVIALLPVVPVAFVVRAIVRLILASDELERRMQLEAISIASMSVGLLSFAAAFLQGAGLLPVDNALMLVLPALFAAYGVAMWWVRRRYRGGE